MNKKETFAFAAGGTAGHIFPALALAQEIKKQNHHVQFITDQRGARLLNNKLSPKEIIILPIDKLNWKFFAFSPYLMLISAKTLLKTKAIISFGGYTSVFPFLSAILLKKKNA